MKYQSALNIWTFSSWRLCNPQQKNLRNTKMLRNMSRVFHSTNLSTKTKKRKTKTKKGKKELHPKMKLWVASSQAARKQLGLGGKGQKFVPVGGKTPQGKQLYRTTKSIFETAKLRGKLPKSYHKFPKMNKKSSPKRKKKFNRWTKIAEKRSRSRSRSPGNRR